MEAGATYTAARPVVTVPAWRASAEKPIFPAGMEAAICYTGQVGPPPLKGVAVLIHAELHDLASWKPW